MSTGLYIKESKVHKQWEGERVWISLEKLGFTAIGTTDGKESEGVARQDGGDVVGRDLVAQSAAGYLPTKRFFFGEKKAKVFLFFFCFCFLFFFFDFF